MKNFIQETKKMLQKLNNQTKLLDGKALNILRYNNSETKLKSYNEKTFLRLQNKKDKQKK